MPSDLGGSGGRLISYPDRKQYCALIDEAVQNGARQRLACELVGIASRTYQRWNQGEELSEDQRIHNDAPAHNTLSEAVRYEILKIINLPEYSTLTPYQIVPTLLDKGQYIASESTFYRVMKEYNQLKHRGKGTAARRKKPQSLKATAANEIYSWDITYLLSPVKGQYHYTYPENPFTDLSEARHWVEKFVHWYNDEHQHSAIKFVTPNQRHSGLDRAILENRKKVIEAARKNHPECWNGRKTRDLTPVGDVYLNPGKDENNATENKLPLKSAA